MSAIHFKWKIKYYHSTLLSCQVLFATLQAKKREKKIDGNQF